MSFFKRLTPFFIAGIFIALLTFGMVLLAYLFIIGAVIGMVLFVVNTVRERFFTPKKKAPPPPPSGRVIDSDDWHKL